MLRAEMRSMMAEDADDLDYDSLHSKKGSLLQTQHAQMSTERVDDSMDQFYVWESSRELSAALGKRWNPQKLDQDADRSTQALLRGIAGHHASISAVAGVQ